MVPTPAIVTHILVSKLVHGEMHGAERASADFLFDHILVYAVYRTAVVFAVCVL